MVGGPPRGVLHETQTTGLPGYNGGLSAPHFTVMPDGTIYQHIPASRAARALKNLAGGVQTNRQGLVCLQVEVVAYSSSDDWTPAQDTAVDLVTDWAKAEWGVPDIMAWPEGSPRMTNEQWLTFTGWCDHGGVPENTHWDIGDEVIPPEVFDDATIPPTNPQEEDMTALFRTIHPGDVDKPKDGEYSVEAWQVLIAEAAGHPYTGGPTIKIITDTGLTQGHYDEDMQNKLVELIGYAPGDCAAREYFALVALGRKNLRIS